MSRKNLSRTVIEGGRYHRNQFDRNHSHRVELAWANGRLAANTFMGWWWFRIVSAHLFDDHADRSNNHLVGGHTVRYVTECALTKGDNVTKVRIDGSLDGVSLSAKDGSVLLTIAKGTKAGSFNVVVWGGSAAKVGRVQAPHEVRT